MKEMTQTSIKTGLLLVWCLGAVFYSKAQPPTDWDQKLSISYIGQQLTHPGLKIGYDHNIYSKKKLRVKKDSATVMHKYDVKLNSSLATFYHRRYQTALFALQEVSVYRRNAKNKYVSIGSGLGYLAAFVPNAYKVEANGNTGKALPVNHHALTAVHASFGGPLNFQYDYFIQPQFLYAFPNFPNGVGYFLVEVGIKYNIHSGIIPGVIL